MAWQQATQAIRFMSFRYACRNAQYAHMPFVRSAIDHKLEMEIAIRSIHTTFECACDVVCDVRVYNVCYAIDSTIK